MGERPRSFIRNGCSKRIDHPHKWKCTEPAIRSGSSARGGLAPPLGNTCIHDDCAVIRKHTRSQHHGSHRLPRYPGVRCCFHDMHSGVRQTLGNSNSDRVCVMPVDALGRNNFGCGLEMQQTLLAASGVEVSGEVLGKLRIPAKANAVSEGKPNMIPG